MADLLITGFAPFGGQKENPSWEAVRALPDSLCGRTLQKELLPVCYLEAAELLREKIALVRPKVLLCVGQAGGAAGIRVERAAINAMAAKAPDNSGRLCSGEPIAPDGPGGYLATLDTAGLREAIAAAGIPTDFSYHAGAYVCNCVFYTGLHEAATRYPEMQVGFVHIPFMLGQEMAPGTPAFPLEQMKNAVRAGAEFLARTIK